ncbi:MAG: ABC transporter ATP-binding protein [Flavobacteriales bacterium]|nr:ABC transporter ATP-binding protein [Flavobacteriales bacterium]
MIELKNIKKTYRTGKIEYTALKNINLTVHQNDYLALMGTSGSGKSTLMNILGALDTPTSGSYTLKGKSVDQLDDQALSKYRNKEIGFVFQTFNLLPKLNAIENVALPLLYADVSKKEREERAKKMLGKVGLSEHMYNKPNEMSGGQRQRVAIARALINEPSIILADEPTGNLDTKTSIEVMEFFKTLHKAGNTIILVTHELDIAEYAEKTIVLKDGEIIEK